jgi:hypothetical protein
LSTCTDRNVGGADWPPGSGPEGLWCEILPSTVFVTAYAHAQQREVVGAQVELQYLEPGIEVELDQASG